MFKKLSCVQKKVFTKIFRKKVEDGLQFLLTGSENSLQFLLH